MNDVVMMKIGESCQIIAESVSSSISYPPTRSSADSAEKRRVPQLTQYQLPRYLPCPLLFHGFDLFALGDAKDGATGAEL